METDIRKHAITALAYASVAVLSLALFGLLFALVRGEGSADVGREGQVAIQAEGALSATAAVRNGASQVVLLSEGVALGWVDRDSLDASVTELETTVDELARRSDQLLTRLPENEQAIVATSTDAFVAAVDELTLQVAEGGSPGTTPADELLNDSYGDLVSLLVDLRDGRVLDVLAAAEGVGRFADAVRFLVVFVIPVGVILGFRRSARRRRERDALEIKLARQTEISASKDEFVANLSHELRTPLTGIYGFALSLSDGGVTDEDTAGELAELIVNEASELNRMVDDLITAGRLEAGQLAYTIEDTDIRAEVDYVIEPFLKTGLDIDTYVDVGLASADRHRLRQILRNLVSNAIKHGGDRVEIASYAVDDQVAIAVIDNGPGVPEDVEGRLFRRYVHEGTVPLLEGSVGLGLAIARRLAEDMGGSLDYIRHNDVTSFEIRLQRAGNGLAATEPATASAH